LIFFKLLEFSLIFFWTSAATELEIEQTQGI